MILDNKRLRNLKSCHHREIAASWCHIESEGREKEKHRTTPRSRFLNFILHPLWPGVQMLGAEQFIRLRKGFPVFLLAPPIPLLRIGIKHHKNNQN